ncbi:hypothetical protein VTI74DRAFT_6616 [Chaetomium olivicolor]
MANPWVRKAQIYTPTDKPVKAWDREEYHERLATAWLENSDNPAFLAALPPVGPMLRNLFDTHTEMLYGIRLSPDLGQQSVQDGETKSPFFEFFAGAETSGEVAAAVEKAAEEEAIGEENPDAPEAESVTSDSTEEEILYASPFELPIRDDLVGVHALKHTPSHCPSWEKTKKRYLRMVDSCDDVGLDRLACDELIEKWKRTIEHLQRDNPHWMNQWLVSYGHDGVNQLSDTQLAAFLGAPLDDAAIFKIEGIFFIRFHIIEALFDEDLRCSGYNTRPAEHKSWKHYQPNTPSPLRQVQTTEELADNSSDINADSATEDSFPASQRAFIKAFEDQEELKVRTGLVSRYADEEMPISFQSDAAEDGGSSTSSDADSFIDPLHSHTSHEREHLSSPDNVSTSSVAKSTAVDSSQNTPVGALSRDEERELLSSIIQQALAEDIASAERSPSRFEERTPANNVDLTAKDVAADHAYKPTTPDEPPDELSVRACRVTPPRSMFTEDPLTPPTSAEDPVNPKVESLRSGDPPTPPSEEVASLTSAPEQSTQDVPQGAGEGSVKDALVDGPSDWRPSKESLTNSINWPVFGMVSATAPRGFADYDDCDYQREKARMQEELLALSAERTSHAFSRPRSEATSTQMTGRKRNNEENEQNSTSKKARVDFATPESHNTTGELEYLTPEGPAMKRQREEDAGIPSSKSRRLNPASGEVNTGDNDSYSVSFAQMDGALGESPPPPPRRR